MQYSYPSVRHPDEKTAPHVGPTAIASSRAMALLPHRLDTQRLKIDKQS